MIGNPRRAHPGLIAALCLCAVAGVRGQPVADGYRLVPSRAVLDLAAGPVDAAALLDAAILFSGADGSRAVSAAAAGRRLLDEAAALGAATRADGSIGDGPARDYELGARVLSLVHSSLSRYDQLESRLDHALAEGRYNCVASSTLYAILATAAGLDVVGVILPDHAYCVLTLGGSRVDVETTSANGYDDATKRPASGLSWGVGGPSGGTDTTVRGIVALVLRNRATLAERTGRWADALALAVDAHAYVSGGRSGPAGDTSTWETLAGRVNNCVSSMMDAGRWADAAALADAAIAEYGSADVLLSLRRTARAASLTDALRRAAGTEALALADGAAAAGEVDAAWLERAYSWAYSSLADGKRKAGDHLGAWAAAAEGTARFPASRELAQLESTARSNWVRSEHNRFAALYNAGSYDEALAVAVAALVLVPDDRILLDDEKTARAAAAGQ